MALYIAPLLLLVSMLLLVTGGIGLLEAQSVCTGLCFFADQTSAVTTGLALLAVGVFTLLSALSLNRSAEIAVAAKSATTTAAAPNIYAEHNKADGIPSLASDTVATPPRDDAPPPSTPRS